MVLVFWWGVGGIEAEAAMLGEASYNSRGFIGVHLTGELPKIATATDLAPQDYSSTSF